MIIQQRERPASASLVGEQENCAPRRQDRPGTPNFMHYFTLDFPLVAAPHEPWRVCLTCWLGTAFIQYP
jgi:hypothetical protein